MADNAEKLVFVCENCGAEPAVLSVPDDFHTESRATCKDCGVEFGPIGKIRELALEGTSEEIAVSLKEQMNKLTVKFV